jgi:hypothetical protein
MINFKYTSSNLKTNIKYSINGVDNLFPGKLIFFIRDKEGFSQL